MQSLSQKYKLVSLETLNGPAVKVLDQPAKAYEKQDTPDPDPGPAQQEGHLARGLRHHLVPVPAARPARYPQPVLHTTCRARPSKPVHFVNRALNSDRRHVELTEVSRPSAGTKHKPWIS